MFYLYSGEQEGGNKEQLGNYSEPARTKGGNGREAWKGDDLGRDTEY